MRAEHLAVWRVRLADLLDERPELDEPLREALAIPRAPTQYATASDNSTVVQAQRDVFHNIRGERDVFINSPGNTARTAVGAGLGGLVGGVAGVGGGVAAAGLSGSGGTAATGGALVSAKVLAVTAVVAGTTVVGGGYVAYQHYTCGSLFGERPAVEVVNEAARRIGDASFRFTFRMPGLEMAGDADNHKKLSTVHGTAPAGPFDAVLDGETTYFRIGDGPWERGTGTATEPRIAQGTPFKTADYLYSAQEVAQADCSFSGDLDPRVLMLDPSGPPVPFTASISPAGDLTRLAVSTPDRAVQGEWQLYDHGTEVTVTPPSVG
ncbi:hypothetical protein [Saccharothrix longispora]|uniref:hypothetical protein n=1 Tax=Saccharothrix longispora TaxID=33920 RepID=UPI0028FD34AB|nr:hypothetical protein [Saccharothrix longispora]MDU0294236.1 hypothetical protein [Saccharothrix longispora]